MALKLYQRFLQGIGIIPKTTTANAVLGDIEVLSSDSKLHFHNGTINDPIVTEATTATLTNKTMDGDNNTFQDISITSLKTALSDAGKFIARNGSGVVVSTNTVPTGTVVGTSDTQTLTNKSMDGNNNTFTNIPSGALPTDVVYLNSTQTLTNKTLIDNSTIIADNSDTTKQLKFNVAGTTSTSTTLLTSQTTNKTLTLPDATDTLVGKTTTDVLTNKTLSGNTSSNFINGSGTININSTGTITVPNATDTLVGKATTDTLTNKTISGNTATNLVSGSGTFTFNTSGTITTPNATDTLVAKATTDILTNKTISGSTNVLGGVTMTLGSDATGDIYYRNVSGILTRLPVGTNGQVLSVSAGLLPSWTSGTATTATAVSATNAGHNYLTGTNVQTQLDQTDTKLTSLNTTMIAVPTIQKFTSTGTTTGYAFTVSAVNATVGATYTNNGNTYTVLSTIVSGTPNAVLYTSQASAPQSSGTLTKASGSGDATISFSSNFPLATYTTAANTLYLKIRLIGGGSGGAGSSTTAATNGGTGGPGAPSFFGAGLLAGFGAVGATTNMSAAGGSASLGNATVGTAFQGGYGQSVGQTSTGNTFIHGGSGGVSPFGGGGGGGTAVTVGTAAIANTGSGGGGGGSPSAGIGGAGGSAGGYVEALISAPAVTYVYAVGSGGAGGTAGTSGVAGGAGASGIIIVEEHYK